MNLVKPPLPSLRGLAEVSRFAGRVTLLLVILVRKKSEKGIIEVSQLIKVDRPPSFQVGPVVIPAKAGIYTSFTAKQDQSLRLLSSSWV